jgi:hypothetical protein
MASAGLTVQNFTPLLSAVKCGHDMIAATKTMGNGWEVRVGVNAGPVVAGIVGDEKYQFDVWCDTVNTAARMTGLGAPGSVVITLDSWIQVQDECEGRSLGQKEVKGYSFKHGKARFHRAGGLRPEELEALLRTVITRVTRTLVRAGVLVAEDEQPYVDLEMGSPYEQLAGAAIRYVIAAVPQAGRATMRLLDPLLAVGESGARTKPFTAALHGFSLNCAIACEVNERAKLERVWRYMARGPLAQERLSGDGDGLVVLELKLSV